MWEEGEREGCLQNKESDIKQKELVFSIVTSTWTRVSDNHYPITSNSGVHIMERVNTIARSVLAHQS
jgi:hypothetical protein